MIPSNAIFGISSRVEKYDKTKKPLGYAVISLVVIGFVLFLSREFLPGIVVWVLAYIANKLIGIHLENLKKQCHLTCCECLENLSDGDIEYWVNTEENIKHQLESNSTMPEIKRAYSRFVTPDPEDPSRCIDGDYVDETSIPCYKIGATLCGGCRKSL